MKHQKEAYRGDPVPQGMADTDTLQYIMLRAMYQAFKAHEIGQEEGEGIKGFVETYNSLCGKDKISLLQYCFTLTTDRAGRGDMDALMDSKRIAQAYRAMTGDKPYG